MQRKARIKVLRGKKSDVGAYKLQYGQPFYDTETGQLYVGGVLNNEQIEEKTLNEHPTVFQDGSGNIKIGSDFKDTSTTPETITYNPKIELSKETTTLNAQNITAKILIGNKNSTENTQIVIGNNNKTRENETDIIIGNNIDLSNDNSAENIIKIGNPESNYLMYIGGRLLAKLNYTTFWNSSIYTLNLGDSDARIANIYVRNIDANTTINGSTIKKFIYQEEQEKQEELVLGGTNGSISNTNYDRPVNTLNVRTINLIVN